MSTPMFIAELNELPDGPIWGGKALGLRALAGLGGIIPRGFAVSATVEPPSAWPEALRAELLERARPLLAEGPVAVRSSGSVEDGAERSYAGLFDSVLGVRTPEALLEAVARCVASGAGERVAAQRGEPGPVPVGVIVQRMIEPASAGVCFTRDPLGHDGALVLEAVGGLGDALMSGHAQPERWRVYINGLGQPEACREPVEGPAVLDQTTALLLAQEARVLARRFAHPLDLEWAVDPVGRLYWLQARPITAATGPRSPWSIERFSDRADDGPISVWGDWNVRETMPEPLSTLSWALWQRSILPVVAEDLFGLPRGARWFAEAVPVDRVAGRPYFNMGAMLAIPLIGVLAMFALRSVDPEAARTTAALRESGVLRARRLPLSRLAFLGSMALAGSRTMWRILRWARPSTALAALAEAGDRIHARTPVADLSDAALYAEFFLLDQPEATTLRSGIAMLTPAMLIWQIADRAFAGLPEARARLATGVVGNPTTEISLSIEALAGQGLPLSERILRERSWPELREDLASDAAGRAWLAALDGLLDRCGHRGPREFDFGAPRWADDPSMILDLIRARLRDPEAEPLAERLERLRREREQILGAAIRAAPIWRRGLLQVLSDAVLAWMPLREAPKHHAMRVFQRVRAAALELGRRLHTRDVLQAPDDIFHLELDEVQALVNGRALPELGTQITARKADLERFRTLRPPHFLRSDGVPVDPQQLAVEPGMLRGAAASPGRVQGPVRVLREPDASALCPGDILVVPYADPGWTPMFSRAGALVMEVGGTLCHAAVVARELGIPAVVGVRGALARLGAGERVEVDGDLGTVRQLSEAT